MKKNKLIIYQTKDGAIALKNDICHKTIWANRMQMAQIFDVNPQAISKHIQNIYKEKELKKKATSSKMELVQNESGRIVKRNVDYYNLDVLISVGYRINSIKGTKFRQWATTILNSHITQGFTINNKRVIKNYQNFLKVVQDVKKLTARTQSIEINEVLELIQNFSYTWSTLNNYDKQNFPKLGTKKKIKVTAEDFRKDLLKLKKNLISKKEASDLFAKEKQKDQVENIFSNVFQTAFKKDVYKTIEEKVAHLLYFIIKDHPFCDGNKRSGAFAFIWFLQKTKCGLDVLINPKVLTTLTILIAESNSKEKEKTIGLILLFLNFKK
jgi:death-on-curing family protein